MTDNFPKFEKKEYTNLEEDNYVKKYLKGVSSIRQRLSLIKEFVEFNEMSPRELIIEHSKDIKQEDPEDQTDIAKDRLHSFFVYLVGAKELIKQGKTDKFKNSINEKIRVMKKDKNGVEKGVSWNSARQYVYSKLASFYGRNKVSIEFLRNEIPKNREDKKAKEWRNGEDEVVEDYGVCLKRILDTLEHVRDKAILLCKVSSGMDDIDIFKLTIGDFNKHYFKKENIAYINGYRQKSDVRFQTFFNREACNMIKLYFKTREKKGEKLTDESWLFVGNKKIEDEYTQLKPRLFAFEMREACKTLEIKNLTPKQVRRWFNTHTKECGVPEEVIERLMGHEAGMSSKYQQIFDEPTKLVKYYIDRIEPHTLLGNGFKKAVENESIKALKLTITTLSNDNNVLNEKIEAMKKEIPKTVENEIKKLEDRMYERMKAKWTLHLKEDIFENK